ncbi:hypothetical protein ACLBV4_32655, partial [Pseudomonas aeruginosa]|uniref:hypothetical protein n=2 Tax=Pseudomonas aeruginosa TaxID=287 RepID=UPI00396928AB
IHQITARTMPTFLHGLGQKRPVDNGVSDPLLSLAKADGQEGVVYPTKPSSPCRVENCGAFSTSGHPGYRAENA